MNTIELIKDAAFFGGNIPNGRLDECRDFFDNVIEKQLNSTDVSNSFCFHTMTRNPKEHQENRCRLCKKPYKK